MNEEYVSSIISISKREVNKVINKIVSTTNLKELISNDNDKKQLFAGLFQHITKELINKADHYFKLSNGLEIKFKKEGYEFIEGNEYQFNLSEEDLIAFGRFFYNSEEMLKIKHNQNGEKLGLRAGFYFSRTNRRGQRVIDGVINGFIGLKPLSKTSLNKRLIGSEQLNKEYFINAITGIYNSTEEFSESNQEKIKELEDQIKVLKDLQSEINKENNKINEKYANLLKGETI